MSDDKFNGPLKENQVFVRGVLYEVSFKGEVIFIKVIEPDKEWETEVGPEDGWFGLPDEVREKARNLQEAV